MKYEEFKEQYIHDVKEYFEEIETDIEMQLIDNCKVNVNNEGLMIKENGSNIGRSISLEEEYEGWLANELSVREYAFKRAERFEQELCCHPELPEISFENMKSNIICDAINVLENKRLLESVTYRQIGDIAIIPRWQIDENMSLIVSNSICKYIGKQPEDILDIAYNNTLDLGFKIGNFKVKDTDAGMYIITNRNERYGAAAIAFPEIMSQLKNVIDGDAYIIPSSRNELIAVQKDITVGKELEMLIQEINATTLSREEFLSNHLYEYNASTNQVYMAELEGRVMQRGRSR